MAGAGACTSYADVLKTREAMRSTIARCEARLEAREAKIHAFVSSTAEGIAPMPPMPTTITDTSRMRS